MLLENGSGMEVDEVKAQFSSIRHVRALETLFTNGGGWKQGLSDDSGYSKEMYVVFHLLTAAEDALLQTGHGLTTANQFII
jgi:hypothetical protein